MINPGSLVTTCRGTRRSLRQTRSASRASCGRLGSLPGHLSSTSLNLDSTEDIAGFIATLRKERSVHHHYYCLGTFYIMFDTFLSLTHWCSQFVYLHYLRDIMTKFASNNHNLSKDLYEFFCSNSNYTYLSLSKSL